MTMIYPYIKFPRLNPDTRKLIGEVSWPYIPIRLIYNHRVSKSLIRALVDSGSDINLFPAEIAEQLNIKIRKGKKLNIGGIGGSNLIGYGYEVNILVDTLGFKSRVYFAYDQTIPILGRKGFFDHFKRVIFKEKEEILELE